MYFRRRKTIEDLLLPVEMDWQWRQHTYHPERRARASARCNKPISAAAVRCTSLRSSNSIRFACRRPTASRRAASPPVSTPRSAAPDGSAPLYFLLRQSLLPLDSTSTRPLLDATRRDTHVSSVRELRSESTSLENQSLTLRSIPEVHATRRGAPSILHVTYCNCYSLMTVMTN